MTKIGNLQLTLANAAATEAEERWKDHKRDCPRCSTAQRARQIPDMCRRGGLLYKDRNETAADLTRERELAKEPYPGQEPLFGPEDIPCA
jgi:hypothetical protein